MRAAIVRLPFALAMGTITFWVGFARLVLMSTRFTADVARGQHPHAALSHLREPREKRSQGF